jgi:hypothetical protein
MGHTQKENSKKPDGAHTKSGKKKTKRDVAMVCWLKSALLVLAGQHTISASVFVFGTHNWLS